MSRVRLVAAGMALGLGLAAGPTARADEPVAAARATQAAAADRYASAEAFAGDIERHLQGDTVSALPGGVLYRAGKALRRHWVGAAAAVLLALSLGGSAAFVQMRKAAQASGGWPGWRR